MLFIFRQKKTARTVPKNRADSLFNSYLHKYADSVRMYQGGICNRTLYGDTVVPDIRVESENFSVTSTAMFFPFLIVLAQSNVLVMVSDIPERSTILRMDFEEITGIIPVVSDTDIPFCAALSMKEYMDLLSENICVTRKSTPLCTFSRKWIRSSSRFTLSTCPSG